MKKLLYSACALALCVASCSKSSNNYTVTDHTVGMVGIRHWTGSKDGYTPGDTTIMSTVHHAWPLHFSHLITDTTFAIEKINGFSINMVGFVLAYRTTDSVAQTVRYDSVITGTLTASLIYFFGKDSIGFEVHRVDSFSSDANQYYQLNEVLHTP